MNSLFRLLFVGSVSTLVVHLGWYFEWLVSRENYISLESYVLFFFLASAIVFSVISIFCIFRSKAISVIVGSWLALVFFTFIGGSVLHRAEFGGVTAYFNQNVIRPIQAYRQDERPLIDESKIQADYFQDSFDYAVMTKIQNEPINIFVGNFDKKELKLSVRGWSDDLSELPIVVDQHNIISYKDHSGRVSRSKLFGNSDWVGTGTTLSHIDILRREGEISESKSDDLLIDTVWSRKGENILHHWGDAFEGKIFVPGRKFVRIPNVISESFLSTSFANCGPGESTSETIEIFDWEDGSHLQSIELLPILSNVEFPLFRQFLNNCGDPIHLNDVVIVKLKSHAKFFPEGQVGDLLISMRQINTIALLDRDTHKVKWHSSLFARQHSPRITDYGTIIVFDNLASSLNNGRSRITEIDIETNSIIGIWEGTDEDFFESETAGRVQLINDRIFVQESNRGRLFELVCPARPISVTCQKINILEISSDDVFILDVLSDYGD